MIQNLFFYLTPSFNSIISHIKFTCYKHPETRSLEIVWNGWVTREVLSYKCCLRRPVYIWSSSLLIGPWEISIKFYKTNFQTNFSDSWSWYLSKIAVRWISLYISDDKSTLVQVMAWCRQATTHYLSQSWPRSLPPYDVTRPPWVNML